MSRTLTQQILRTATLALVVGLAGCASLQIGRAHV